MKPSEYAQFDAVGLSAAIKKGDITAAEVAEVAIDLVEAMNPALNAVVMTSFEQAREQCVRCSPNLHAGALADTCLSLSRLKRTIATIIRAIGASEK